MTETIITIIEDTTEGVTKESRIGTSAEQDLDNLKLTPTKFVKEVKRKLKDNTKEK